MTKIVMDIGWYHALGTAFASNNMINISKGIDFAIEKHGIESVYPKKGLIFKAFELTPLAAVKVIMIGLEPTVETASGLLFESTNAPVDKMSDQLVKIFKVYCEDYPKNFNVDLMSGMTSQWAKAGVLMLNLSLSARSGSILKHFSHWEFFYTEVFKVLKAHENPIAWLPFGKTPTEKINDLNLPAHHRGFQFKVGVFIEINKWLTSVGSAPISW